MNANDVYSKLRTGTREVTFTPQVPLLAKVSDSLQHVLDDRGRFRLLGAERTPSRSTEPRKPLLLSGRANLLGDLVEGVDVRVDLDDEGDVADLHIAADLDEDWTLGHHFPALTGATDPLVAWLVTLDLVTPRLVVRGVEGPAEIAPFADVSLLDGTTILFAAPSSGGDAATVLAELPAPPALLAPHLSGAFDVGRLRIEGTGHTADLELIWRVTGATALDFGTPVAVGVRLLVDLDNPSARPQASWVLETELGSARLSFDSSTLGEPFFQARETEHASVTIAELAGGTAPDLSSHVSGGLEPVVSHLAFSPVTKARRARIGLHDSGGDRSGLKAIPALSFLSNVLTLKEAGVELAFDRQGTLSWSLYAETEIAGAELDVEFAPGTHLQLNVSELGNATVEAIVSALSGTDVSFPGGRLALTDVELSVDLSGPQTEAQLALQCAGDLELVPDGGLSLGARGLTLGWSGGSVVEIALLGSVRLGDATISVRAERDAAGDWTILGSASLEHSLTAITRDLLHGWNIELPEGVPEVHLDALSLSYATGNKGFGFNAATRWTPPAGSPGAGVEVDASLRLMSWLDPTTHKRKLEVDIAWQADLHEFGVIDGQLDIEPDGQTFLMTWTASQADPVGIPQIAGLISEDLKNAVPSALDVSAFRVERFAVGVDHHESTSMTLMAGLGLGKGELVFEADVSKLQTRLAATWTAPSSAAEDRLGIQTLLDELDTVSLRGGFSGGAASIAHTVLDGVGDALSFEALSLSYIGGDKPTFEIVGHSGHGTFAEAFVVVRKDPGWGVIVGLAFAPDKGVGELPFLRDIPGFTAGWHEVEDALGLHLRGLIISTLDARRFTPPGFDAALIPAPPSSTLPAKPGVSSPLGNQPLRLSKGAALVVHADFEHSKNPVFQLFHEVTGVKGLDSLIVFGNSGIGLTASIGGSLRLEAGGAAFRLADPYVGVFVNPPGFSVRLGGRMELALFGTTFGIEGMLALSDAAIAGSIHLENIPFEIPLGQAMPGIRILKDDLWLELGMQFEPEGLDLGFMGAFRIGPKTIRSAPSPYHGDVVLVLEMIEEVPNPLFIHFSIEQLDLFAMFEAKTGIGLALEEAQEIAHTAATLADAAGLDEGEDLAEGVEAGLGVIRSMYDNLQSILSEIALHDVDIRWADSIVLLPDGTTANPGLGFRGWLDIFGFHMFASFEFSLGMPPNLTGHFEMDPLDILGGAIKITGDGQGVRLREAKGEANAWEYWKDAGSSASTIRQAKQSPDATYVVKPGGANLLVSARQSPFLHANLRVVLFNTLSAEVLAEITDQGFHFLLDVHAGGFVTLKLESELETKGPHPHFSASGKLGVHIKGDIGPIIPGISATKIHLDVGLDAEVDLVIGETFHFGIGASFEFMGAHLSLPHLVIDTPLSTFEDLPGIIWDHIEEFAEEIFEDVFLPIGKAFEEAAEAVAEVATEAAEAVAEIATEAVAECKEVVEHAARVVEQAAADVAHAAEEVVAAAKEIEKKAEEFVADVGAKTVEAVHALEHQAEVVFNEAKKAVEAIGAAVEHEVAEIGQEIAHAAAEAAAFVADLANRVGHEVQHLLDSARAAAEHLWSEALQVAAELERQIANVINEIAAIGRQIEEVAADIAHFFEDVGAAIVNTAEEVGEALDPTGW